MSIGVKIEDFYTQIVNLIENHEVDRAVELILELKDRAKQLGILQNLDRSVIRSFPLTLTLALDRDLALDIAHALDLARDLAHARDIALARDHALDIDLALDLAHARDHALDLALDLAHARDHALDLALDLAQALDIDIAQALDIDIARSSGIIATLISISQYVEVIVGVLEAINSSDDIKSD
ncbi:MAG: hypothetical protein ABI947_02730 [Chloroflexota bacterium]